MRLEFSRLIIEKFQTKGPATQNAVCRSGQRPQSAAADRVLCGRTFRNEFLKKIEDTQNALAMAGIKLWVTYYATVPPYRQREREKLKSNIANQVAGE